MATPEEEGFKVVDRRGRLREAAEAPLIPETRVEPPAPKPAAPESPPPPPQQGPSLTPLFVMLARSALMHLGEADPMTGERVLDLEGAREVIDLLLLLRDKTQGHRSEEESRALEQILYEVQLRFVHAARGGGQR
jgi:hypothetical protein